MKITNPKISQKPSSAAWVRRQLADPFVERAKKEGFRARAVYKLSGIDEKLHILKNGQIVVDLGAAPGSWSQWVRKNFPKSRVIAMDLLDIAPIPGVDFYKGDFTAGAAEKWLREKIGGKADIVLSDMAPNTTGHQKTDHLRQSVLLEYALDFAAKNLRPGGAFVAKVFAGGTTPALLSELKKYFAEVKHIKPAASRKDSVEMFVVGVGFRNL